MANIFQAGWFGDVSRLKTILDAGGSVDEKNGDGYTALHLSAENGHVTAMAFLLDRGADLSAIDYLGYTALHLSAENGHVTAMALLLDHGADLRATNRDGCTALHWAAYNGHVAAMAFLLDRGADLSATTSAGKTALHWAAGNGHVTAMTLLLDRGADPSATDNQNHTARDVAADHEMEGAAQEMEVFSRNMADEWRPLRHALYPLPFRNAVATVLAMWCWNPTANAAWHPESPFPLLSLELLFEVFIWLGADIANRGYLVAVPVTPR